MSKEKNRASTLWFFRKTPDKHCNGCQIKFGTFSKKRICWECNKVYCGKCVYRVHDHKFSIIRTKKYCCKCYEEYMEVKRASAPVEEMGHKESMIDIGAPSNVVQQMHVVHQPEAPNGFHGLPREWEDWLFGQGITREDLANHPMEVMGAASIIQAGGLRPMPSTKEFVDSVKKNLTVIEENPAKFYNSNRKIGSGATGFVYFVTHYKTGKVYALKQTQPKNKKEERNIVNEIALMQLSPHPNIITYYESYKFKNAIYAVIELMECNLTQLLKRMAGSIPEELMAYILREICQGLAFLHESHRIHRDIKSDNILIDLDGNVKLGDFGFAAQLTEEQTARQSVVGTPAWMSPELIVGEKYTTKVDIWSLGILALELVDGDPPHLTIPPIRALFLISKGDPPTLKKPQQWSTELNDFIAQCLVKEPEARASAEALLRHPFIQKANSPQSKENFGDFVSAWKHH